MNKILGKRVQTRLIWYLVHHILLPDGKTSFRGDMPAIDSVFDFATSVEQENSRRKVTLAVVLDIPSAPNLLDHEPTLQVLLIIVISDI